jgi:TonB dependent receptor
MLRALDRSPALPIPQADLDLGGGMSKTIIAGAFIVRGLLGEADIGRFQMDDWLKGSRHVLRRDQNMLYASVSTGFSPGDVSVTTNPTGDPYALGLDAETLTTYEIGSKNRFLDNRLQVNGAVYYNDYGAYQTTQTNVTRGRDY